MSIPSRKLRLGRRRSSRFDDSLVRRLGRPSALGRLGVAGLTTLAVTVLAVWWGPPLPYRVGEIYPHDLRARVDFEVLNQVELFHDGVPDQEIAHTAERPVLEKYPKGTILAQRGHPLGQRQLDLLREEHD